MTTQTIKVAPPNPHKSKYPRLTHKIALAGGKDFYNAKIKFGLQLRPADSQYRAICVNPQFWRLRYGIFEPGKDPKVFDYKQEKDQLSEKIEKWQSQDPISRKAVAELTLANGQTMSAALRDISSNGHLYAFECFMATAIVRLFVSRRGVIGTDADFHSMHESDSRFDALYPSLRAIPIEGLAEVPGLKWLKHEHPLTLHELEANDEHRVRPGDWIYFTHPFLDTTDPYHGENALWLGGAMIYAHDYGEVSLNEYFANVRQHCPENTLSSVRTKTKIALHFVSE